MPDAIGHYDEILRGVQRLAGAKQLPGEFRADELRAAATRAMTDEHCIAHHAFLVLLRGADSAVVNAQLGKRFAAREAKVPDDVVAFGGRGIVGRECGVGE